MNAQTDRAGDRLMLDLRDSIRRGDLRSGARLAPLRELAEHYGVTTSKAQRVVQRLAREADRGAPVCSGRMLVEPRLVVRRSAAPPKA